MRRSEGLRQRDPDQEAGPEGRVLPQRREGEDVPRPRLAETANLAFPDAARFTPGGVASSNALFAKDHFGEEPKRLPSDCVRLAAATWGAIAATGRQRWRTGGQRRGGGCANAPAGGEGFISAATVRDGVGRREGSSLARSGIPVRVTVLPLGMPSAPHTASMQAACPVEVLCPRVCLGID